MIRNCEAGCDLYIRPEPAELHAPENVILGASVADAIANREPRKIGYCRWRETLSPKELEQKRIRPPLSAIKIGNEYRCGADDPTFSPEELAKIQQPCYTQQLNRLREHIQPHKSLLQKLLKVLKTIPIMN